MIEVQLTSNEALDAAVALVREHTDEAAEVVGSSAESMVRFRTSRSENDLADLLSRLVHARIGVCQFREVQSDLEEAFLSFMRQSGDDALALAPGARIPE